MRTILSLLFMLAMLSFAGAQPQTFEDYINSLPPATIPLGSGDQLYVRQLGVSKQVPGSAFAPVPGVSIIGTPALGQVPIATSTSMAAWGFLTIPITGTPAAGQVPIATSSTAASWGQLTIPVTGTPTAGQVPIATSGTTAAWGPLLGVPISGIPAAGQVPIATSPTAAAWAPLPGIPISGVPAVGYVPIATSPTAAAWAPLPSSAPGMVGDGTTNNTAVFQALLTTAGANGGSVNIPCGTFVIGGTTSLAVAASKSVTVTGQGLCTTLAFQGVNATAITIGNVFSSIHWGHMRLTTNAAGAFSGLIATLNANPVPLFSVHHIFEDLHFTGDDYTGAALRYWNVDLTLKGLTNVQIDNVTSLGALGGRGGTGVFLQGDTIAMKPAVIVNFKNYLSVYHNIGIDWEGFTEGVSVVASNFQSNNYGIRAAPGVADLSQLSVVNSQFGDNIIAGISATANVSQLAVSNSLFEMGAGQTGILGTGQDFKIVGNSFLDPANLPSGMGVGISLTTAGGYGAISANNFTALASGINGDSSSTYSELQISNNIHAGFLTMYNITGGTNIFITDNQAILTTVLLPCISAIAGSTMTIANNNTAAAYHGPISSGGSGWTRVFCLPSGTWVQN